MHEVGHANKLAKKIFSRKVVRKNLKPKMDFHKLKKSIDACKQKYSEGKLEPVSKPAFRHKKYNEKYLQMLLTRLKIIKAL